MGKYKELLLIVVVVALAIVVVLPKKQDIEPTKELTLEEIYMRETEINELKYALIMDGDFVVQSDGTVEYNITYRDDALLDYNLYKYYLEMEENGTPVERKTAEELWAEVPLDTWNLEPGSYLWNYKEWGWPRFDALVQNRGGDERDIENYNETLDRLDKDQNNFSNYKIDIETMTPEKIVRFEEKYSEFEEKRDNIELTEEYLKEFTDWVENGEL